MLFDTILAILIGFLTLFIPGILFALALLKNTKLHIIEIISIGFIFGFMALPTLTWVEVYLMNTIHFFTFSLTLNYLNFVILTVIGLILCFWQGVFKDFKKNFITENKTNVPKWAWILFILIILSVFITRFINFEVSPTFFEFDPYFDMISTQYVLTYGQQITFDHAAWPAIVSGVNHKMEPLIPYVEAYWYDIANSLGPHLTSLSTTMLSLVSDYYPPIAAALLVIVIFMILYHEYDWRIGLIGAGLTATMPVLLTTFIAGEQLLEPWGIFTMFFFIAAYMLAVKDTKSKRLAILASIAFISNFIGAHYYTVTVAILALYIIIQGVINFLRDKEIDKDFYIMNGIIILSTIIFFIFYYPYGSTLQNRTPTVLGIPSPISYPLLALIFIAILQYAPIYLKKYSSLFNHDNLKKKIEWLVIIFVLAVILILSTNIKNSFSKYLELSVHFTTPSSPLFMTVQEYVPTGFTYNFGASGLGIIAASIGGFPLILWAVIILSIILLIIKIIDENSKTSILYIAISVPLLLAGFSEVKYLPHFGVAYILLFSIMLGELIVLVNKGFKFKFIKKENAQAKDYSYISSIILSIGIFAISSILAVLYLLYLYLGNTFKEKRFKNYMLYVAILFVILSSLVVLVNHGFPYGESSSYMDVGGSAIIAFTTPQGSLWNNNVCSALQKKNYSIGEDLFCNQIPQYWLNAMAWIRNNVGPNAPRVLSWWDYGDWINWYGNSYAVLRGDNADPKEDYAVAAQYVLGSKDNYTPQVLANYMNGNQTEYALFDEDLIGKWGALDFLGCVHANETSYQFAVQQGQAQNHSVPYELGTSECELKHDPQYVFIPLALVEPNTTNSSINYYCSISNSTHAYGIAILTPAINQSNETMACVSLTPTSNGAIQLYTQKGAKMNAFLWMSPLGITTLQNIPMVEYMAIYTPNGPNNTITDAPTEYYLSNYYKAFFLGDLPGFTQVYPQNSSNGVNFINYTYPVRIYKLNNYTGGLPPSTSKPSWVSNSYSIPA